MTVAIIVDRVRCSWKTVDGSTIRSFSQFVSTIEPLGRHITTETVTHAHASRRATLRFLVRKIYETHQRLHCSV